MLTEKEVLEWLTSNWQSVLIAIMLSKTYWKVRTFVDKLEKVYRRQKTHRKLCVKRNPENAVELWEDDEKDGK